MTSNQDQLTATERAIVEFVGYRRSRRDGDFYAFIEFTPEKLAALVPFDRNRTPSHPPVTNLRIFTRLPPGILIDILARVVSVSVSFCGIVRTVALDGLNAQEYIHDTVPMLIWSATESTVTIMCSSIPVLRPLYVRLRYGSKNDSSSAGQDSSSYKLPMYGNNSPGKYGLGSTPGIGAKNELDASHRTVITYNADNASDESILPDTKVQGINETGAGIRRIDRVDVRYEVYPEQKQ